ncbi:MAG: glucose/galactose MFS transporter [Ignavibacterium sp.]|nr:glucose/galactose MFS transporter [Ignavibacterium sp.]
MTQLFLTDDPILPAQQNFSGESGLSKASTPWGRFRLLRWKVVMSLLKLTWRFLGAVAIFVYVGGEVSIGSFLVKYFSFLDSSLVESEAGKLVSFYWGGAMVGRFVGSAVQRKINPGYVLAFNAVVAAVLVATSMLTFGSIAMWTILLVGLFNSIMFPTIFTLAIDGLGKHTGQGSGILCMAIVGGAIIPLIQGLLADNIGIHHAFFLPILCYIYIAYYGIKGHKPSFNTAKA